MDAYAKETSKNEAMQPSSSCLPANCAVFYSAGLYKKMDRQRIEDKNTTMVYGTDKRKRQLLLWNRFILLALLLRLEWVLRNPPAAKKLHRQLLRQAPILVL